MIHLDAKTGFSFRQGYGKPEQWLKRCLEVGASTFGIADYCSVWGHIPFSLVFDEVKLVYGVQIPVVRSLTKGARPGLVTLIATDSLTPLYEALTLANEQTYYQPRLTWQQLKQYSVNLLVNQVPLDDLDLVPASAFVIPSTITEALIRDGYPAVATGTPEYPDSSLRAGYKLATGGDGRPLLRRSEYEAIFPTTQEWFENAEKIAAECTATIRHAELPEIDGPSLEVLAKEGAANRGINISDGPYRDRLEREFAVINSKKFGDYFRMVADVVSWAKNHMLVGPGRGSAGGSLVCYLLGITEVDPLVHDTLFERFLDPGRSDFPDIDVDFPDSKRELVFQYLRDKYGAEHVARLGTITYWGGPSALLDAGRALDIPLAICRDLSKEYQNGPQNGLETFLEDHPTEYPQIKQASLLEGHPRHSGVHAAGVCITRDRIQRYTALAKGGVAHVDLKGAEHVGMLKLDALGLRTLSVLDDCKILVGKTDMPSVLAEDDRVYEVFNSDNVAGIFQFEGHAVRSLMKQVNVECFDDLCALTSLARPGPLVGGAAENFVKRRAGHVEYECAYETLRDTFGVIIYQEQAMSLAREVARLSDEEVNDFRRAIGKKDPEKLKSYEPRFPPKLWEELYEFGSYAFNKSHAVAYSMLSYWCAWFKAYHPLEFALAQLKNHCDEDTAKQLLRQVEFVPFCPHRSTETWSIQDGKLYGGFTSVHGIGHKTAKALVEAREQNGPYWLAQLTASQRKKLTSPENTPWHTLSRLNKRYRSLYENPRLHRSQALPSGVASDVLELADIPDEKGTYVFIGDLKRIQPREKVSGGKVVGEFCNVYFDDDSGSVGCTISRQKWPHFKWLLEEKSGDFLVKATDINGDGRKWLFIDKLVKLGEDDATN